MPSWRVTFSRVDEPSVKSARDIEHDDWCAAGKSVGDIVNGNDDGYTWEFSGIQRIWRPILHPVVLPPADDDVAGVTF